MAASRYLKIPRPVSDGLEHPFRADSIGGILMFKTDSILGAGRRMALAVAALGACATIAASPALAAEQDFSLVNATGYEISELYVAPSQTSDWQEDVLGQDVLADA